MINFICKECGATMNIVGAALFQNPREDGHIIQCPDCDRRVVLRNSEIKAIATATKGF